MIELTFAGRNVRGLAKAVSLRLLEDSPNDIFFNSESLGWQLVWQKILR
jgi:hypothetical protein